jgi:hypothetical protein
LDFVGIALVITALGTVTTPFIVAYYGRKNEKSTTAVHDEVKTINAQSIAQLADATETRRIEEIPVIDRSKMERSHMRSVETHNEEE